MSDLGGIASAESVPRGPSLHRLEAVSDPELMRQVLQRHLQPLDGETYEVRECGIAYVRRRSASDSVLLECTLRLRASTTGREWSQLVTGVIYSGGRTLEVWEALQRSNPGRAIPQGPALAPFAYVSDLDMLVQVFPYDHRLPALARLLAGPPPELVPLLLARFGPGDWRAEAWEAESVRYRVDWRAAVRVTVRAREAATGRAEERRFYAKVYRAEGGGEQAYRVLRELSDQAGLGGVGFAVARPIAYLGGLRVLLQDEAPGTPLNRFLRREGEAIPAVRQAGRAVASLHLADVVPPPRPLRDEVAQLNRAGDLLRSACPWLEPDIEATVGAVLGRLDEVPPAPTHGDLKPAHILLEGDRVALLDFDNLTGADPVLDVANLLVHLTKERGRARRPDNGPRAVARAFAEEYFAHVPEAWRARLPLRYAMAVLNKAAGSYRGQDRGGGERTAALLQEARDALAGRLW